MDDSYVAAQGYVPGKPTARPTLIPRMRDALRVRRYGMKTETAYVHWVLRLGLALLPRHLRHRRARHRRDPAVLA